MIRAFFNRLATWMLVTLARAKWGLPVGLMPVTAEARLAAPMRSPAPLSE